MNGRLLVASVTVLGAVLVPACSGDDRGGAPTTTRAGGGVGGDSVGDPYTPDSGATGFDVTHYDLDLAWDPEALRLEGTATVTATATEHLARFSLDLLGLEVERVTVDGEAAEVARDERDLAITPASPVPVGDEFAVTVTYGGTPETVGTVGFLDSGWNTTRNGTSWVIGEPDGACTWFPSNDHPSDKATVDLRVEVPDGWTAASNGVLAGQTHDGGHVVWSWSEQDPIATYLVTVAIGRFEVVEDRTDDGLPLVSFVPQGDGRRFRSQFADAGEMIAAFEERFGPYPFDAYGAIVAPPGGLALETQTRTTFEGIDLVGDEHVRAHELAHQWFGDAVTPNRWEDTWLNEGFATYAEYLWQEASRPDYQIDRSIRQIYYSRGWGPAVDPGPGDWFGSIYQRGALALHALRRQVGDEAFFTILRRWVADHRYGNATTDDFIALAEEISGQDLDAFFRHWLLDRRLPPLPG